MLAGFFFMHSFISLKGCYAKGVKSYVLVCGCAALIFFCSFFAVQTYVSRSCVSPSEEVQHMSSHGWNVWKGASYQSFTHHGEWICVPSGWMPVGAEAEQKGRARFSRAGDGVLVRTDSFSVRSVVTKKHDFAVRVVYPNALTAGALSQYLEIITRAFDAVGDQYPNASGTPLTHTVLLSVGIAGDGHDFETSIYPQPSLYMSVLVHNLAHPRTEELYIHAIAHLYNRYRTDLIAYKAHQAPLRPIDWEELEASWSELAFRSSKEGLEHSVAALTHVYFDIVDNSFSAADLYPFNNKAIFDAVRYKTAILPDDAKYPDEQFGHYILGPLLLVSVEGRLVAHSSSAHIQDIFIRIHATNENFFAVLSEYLPADDIAQIEREVRGDKVLSNDFIERGTEYYRSLHN